jgi:hypothetical protein
MVNLINWWGSNNDIQDTWFITFFESCCKQFIDADHSRINVYTVFGPTSNIVKANKENVNIFFTGENTNIMHTHYSNETQISNYMDIILSFFNKTSKSIRFPLWLTYWNFELKGLFEIPITEKDNKAIIVVSHNANGFRTKVCEKIKSKNIEVNSSTTCISNTQIVKVEGGSKGKIETLKKYKYNICCENSICEGYVTEKIFECFAGGCIPIYSGCKNVESKILYSDQIVYIDEIDEKLNKNENLNLDLNRVWKPEALVYIYSVYLKLWSIVYRKLECKKLNDNILVVKYDCNSREQALDKIVEHWLKYNNFFVPRIHIILKDEEKFIEDFAEELYNKYNLNNF